MANGAIPDENINASSEYTEKHKNHQRFYSQEARLHGESCWRARLSSENQPWIQADIGYQTYVSGVVTQGDGGIGPKDWVKTLKVSTFSKSTNDNEVFVQDESGNEVRTE